jgi:hypothetical protein
MMLARPVILTEHDGITVARDDLYPGGTKARYAARLFDGDVAEVVYATPAQGGAQIALASAARELGRKATLFVAKSNEPHPATRVALMLGAFVEMVPMGYLSNVQAKARYYAMRTEGAVLAPFGFAVPFAEDAIAEAARSVGFEPDEVWCAAASGTLARGLAKAFPSARRHVVRVGREFSPEEVCGATPHVYPRPYNATGRIRAPFSANENYETKAWEICLERHTRGARVLFWNVTASAVDLLKAGASCLSLPR